MLPHVLLIVERQLESLDKSCVKEITDSRHTPQCRRVLHHGFIQRPLIIHQSESQV